MKYGKIYGFHDGLAAVSNNYYWGFVDTNGKVVVQPQYDSVSDFFGGLSLVKKGGKYGVLKLTHSSTNLDGQ